MAIYRQVQTTIWQDNWFSELEPTDKLFWFYLLTNIKTSQSGVYEYSERQAAFDTGLSRKEVAGALQRFIEAGRVLYDQATSEIMICNWMKFNSARSPKVAAVIDRELESIKSREFESEVIKAAQQFKYPIRAKLENLDTVSDKSGYRIDMVSQPEPEPEPEPEPTHNQHVANAAAPENSAGPSIAFFQENLGVMPPIVMEQVMDWVKDLGNDLVIEAIKRAAESQKEWRYAQGILRHWDKDGIRTIDQVKADDVSHNRQAQQRGGRPSRVEQQPAWLKDHEDATPAQRQPKVSQEQLAEQMAKLRDLQAKGQKQEATQ
ncbi:DnaD domain-containing protein [Lacticaseibacillus nasuensis]|uniref:DnaB/C C-terminal domain-containing protein n=1 Tax=Lacticaseibacillus nasuensis JCM 17158 TaxID=1291734 RepID=A0A0R1JKD2_9LACO|nr:DnaD domain protein [Lacticaseibacillus nasuensis]KRK71888.1 hypothetical protein FD02_GL002137 [Lacticaseibacillus nasuensis JCM 17158]